MSEGTDPRGGAGGGERSRPKMTVLASGVAPADARPPTHDFPGPSAMEVEGYWAVTGAPVRFRFALMDPTALEQAAERLGVVILRVRHGEAGNA